jgi:hypothetical protein
MIGKEFSKIKYNLILSCDVIILSFEYIVFNHFTFVQKKPNL